MNKLEIRRNQEGYFITLNGVPISSVTKLIANTHVDGPSQVTLHFLANMDLDLEDGTDGKSFVIEEDEEGNSIKKPLKQPSKK